MRLTQGQIQTLNHFKNGENILLLGDSGTGKSTLISLMVSHAESKGLTVSRTASTGIAAQLINGQTIHSLLKAFPGMMNEDIDYASKASNLDGINVLIIDEISMLGSKFVDFLYMCLKHCKHRIQLVLVGDFFQLPPVKDTYAFNSPSWSFLNLVPCQLTEIIRQEDIEFIKHITMLKYGDRKCLPYLLSHSSPVPIEGQITICATRKDAQHINRTEIEKLKSTPHIYSAEYEGSIDTADLRIEEFLVLKIGMRVMAVTNGSGYSNGSIGTVASLSDSSADVIFDNHARITFTRENFAVERKDIPGTTTSLRQIPLRPAYAITIHKSQGQTFRYVNIDGTKCWAPGQLYVAVSRACSIEGIHFLTPIKDCNIKTDPTVVRYYNRLIH